MTFFAKMLILLFSLITFAYILYLIRNRKMKKEYSVTWFVIGISFILITLFQGLADRIAYTIGINYPPALYFLIALIFLIINMIYFSIEISRLSDQNKELIQELALLKYRMERQRKAEEKDM